MTIHVATVPIGKYDMNGQVILNVIHKGGASFMVFSEGVETKIESASIVNLDSWKVTYFNRGPKSAVLKEQEQTPY